MAHFNLFYTNELQPLNRSRMGKYSVNPWADDALCGPLEAIFCRTEGWETGQGEAGEPARFLRRLVEERLDRFGGGANARSGELRA